MQARLPYNEKADFVDNCCGLLSGWQAAKLGNLVTFKNGLNYSASSVGPGTKIIGVADFQDYQTPRYDQLQELAGLENLDAGYLLKESDLLFVRSNGNKDLIGRALLIENITERVTHSGFTIRARVVSSLVTPQYLAMLVRSKNFKLQIAKLGGGTNISNLSQGILSDIILPLPPRAEQNQIIQILDATDASIYTITNLVEVKAHYKRALAEQLITAKRRFPELKGQIWQRFQLGELFTERIEMNRPDLKLLAITGTEGIVDRNSLVKRDTSNADKSKYLRVAPGDIAYNTMRMWQGVFGLSTMEGIVSPAYTVCTPNGYCPA